MRLLIIIIIFNSIACSWAFAGHSTTAGVKCKISYPNIELIEYSGDIEQTLYPGTRSELLKFEWQYRGGRCLSYCVSGAWTEELGEHFFIDLEELKNTSGTFNFWTRKSKPIKYNFRINCRAGTPTGSYTGVYTITISYN